MNSHFFSLDNLESKEETDGDMKKPTTTIRTNMSTMKRRNRDRTENVAEVTTQKPIVVTGGSSDLYSQFKRRHRLNIKPETTTTAITTKFAQDRSDYIHLNRNHDEEEDHVC